MAICFSVSSFRPVSRRWVGKTVRPGSSSEHEQHEHVAVLALAADLVGVDARGLVAVVAVGDQQLRVGQGALERGDGVGVARCARACCGCRRGRSPRRRARLGGLRRAPRAAAPSGSGKRLKMGERLARVARVSRSRSSFGPGVGALVGPDAAGAVVLHAHAREEAGAGALRAVGRRVVLAEHPDGRLVLLTRTPCWRQSSSMSRAAWIVALAAGRSRRRCRGCAPASRARMLVVDDVVGRRDHILERAGGVGLVAERPERLNVGHRAAPP